MYLYKCTLPIADGLVASSASRVEALEREMAMPIESGSASTHAHVVPTCTSLVDEAQ